MVGDGVCLLHGVTLGGTGNQTGDRHPKVGKGCHIGAGSSILGNIPLGEVRMNEGFKQACVLHHVYKFQNLMFAAFADLRTPSAGNAWFQVQLKPDPSAQFERVEHLIVVTVGPVLPDELSCSTTS